jgi:dipeptidase E
MKKLFLSSSFQDVTNIFTAYQKDLIGKTVTFIPTASIVEEVTFYVVTGKKALEKMGLIVDELEVSTASADEIERKIKQNDFIYVTGGNTFFLLQELKRTGADQLIIEEVNAGKLYIGESAGSIVTSPNIEYAKGMDSEKAAPDLDNLDALGLVDFYTIPHHTNPPFEEAAQSMIDTYSATLQLSPISNQDAILVCGDKLEIIRG